MQVFRAECDCGWRDENRRTRPAADSALSRHRCPPKPKRCKGCGLHFLLLVDDILCIGCDLLAYPPEVRAA